VRKANRDFKAWTVNCSDRYVILVSPSPFRILDVVNTVSSAPSCSSFPFSCTVSAVHTRNLLIMTVRDSAFQEYWFDIIARVVLVRSAGRAYHLSCQVCRPSIDMSADCFKGSRVQVVSRPLMDDNASITNRISLALYPDRSSSDGAIPWIGIVCRRYRYHDR